MKKKNLKSLSLNKEVISNLQSSKIEGGSVTITVTCTLGPICQAADDFIDGFISGWNNC